MMDTGIGRLIPDDDDDPVHLERSDPGVGQPIQVLQRHHSRMATGGPRKREAWPTGSPHTDAVCTPTFGPA